MSIGAFSQLGSSASVTGRMRVMSNLSATEEATVLPSISVLSFARIGSSWSLTCRSTIGGSPSVLDAASIGNGFSVRTRTAMRLGTTLSVKLQVNVDDRVFTYLLLYDHDEIEFVWFYELFWMIVGICFALMIGKWGELVPYFWFD